MQPTPTTTPNRAPHEGDEETDSTVAPDLPAGVTRALSDLPAGIYVVPWPSEDHRRRFLDESGLPRLLLIEPGATVPPTPDCLEDWVLASASTDEIVARAATLQAHADAHEQPRPAIEPNGIVSFGRRLTTVDELEARVLHRALAEVGAIAPTSEVAAAIADREPAMDAEGDFARSSPDGERLHETIAGLRRALAPLGLSIEPVGDVGFTLVVDPLGPVDLAPRRGPGRPDPAGR